MYPLGSILILIIISVRYSGCWVFNNVNFTDIAPKSLDEFDNISEVSNEIGDGENFPEQRLDLIYPGTKWCGAGNIADSYDDLGPSRETDKCCRDHDFCPDVIEAGETSYSRNLTNDAYYSRLSCECDEDFRRCLRRVKAKNAKIIGSTYFNVLGTRCFRRDYPTTGCKRKSGWLGTKCVEYSYDTTRPQYYQWFDVPNF